MKRRYLLISVIIAVVLLIVALHPLILEGVGRFLIIQDKLSPSDVILVLAGDANGERVAEGVKLYKAGLAKKMLVSGGPLAWNLTSAEWMKRQAVAMGVPAGDILLQDRSRSTLEDIAYSLPVIKEKGFKSVILVTSPYHTRRSKRVFRKMGAGSGVSVSVYPAQNSDFKLDRWWLRHEDTSHVVWEYVAMVYYFLKGY
jgi:uncharacterized SAM-binding protein YcdF (DUF218 family)